MRNGSVLIMNFSQDHKKNAEMSTLSVNDWKKKSSVPWCFLEERA